MKWIFVVLTSIVAASFSMSCLEQAQHEQSSRPNITNGLNATDDQFQAVVLLLANFNSDKRLCTGTFLSDSKLVTAAHCLPQKPVDLWVVRQDFHGSVEQESSSDVPKSYYIDAQALSFTVHPEYSNNGSSAGFHPHDLAVVEFPIGTSSTFVRLATRIPNVDEDVTLVGFGSDQASEGEGVQFSNKIGIKRFGQSRLTGVEAGLLVSKGLLGHDDIGVGAGLWVATGPGDSGGPMLLGGKLVAITSGGGIEQTSRGTQVGVSKHVDLTNPSNAAFIQKVLD
jgi:V8-like Glu-specific endopeptidase